MKLSKLKDHLRQLDKISFQLPNGKLVPSHFHVTEVGKVNKHFIDCGGVVRMENIANIQLWEANDYDHHLHPEKLIRIIELSEKTLGIEDLELEVEYQGSTIEKYNLGFDGSNFLLESKFTDCLAKDNCNVPPDATKVKLSDLKEAVSSCCSPESTCC